MLVEYRKKKNGPWDFARPIFPQGLLTITLDGLSEIGTTRGQGDCEIVYMLITQAVRPGFRFRLFSAECTSGMVWGLTSLKHYGTMAIRHYGNKV